MCVLTASTASSTPLLKNQMGFLRAKTLFDFISGLVVSERTYKIIAQQRWSEHRVSVNASTPLSAGLGGRLPLTSLQTSHARPRNCGNGRWSDRRWARMGKCFIDPGTELVLRQEDPRMQGVVHGQMEKIEKWFS